MMNDAVATDFLSLASADRKVRTEKVLRVIFEGVNSGSILNVDYKDAKDSLDRTAEEAFRAATESFWVGKGGKIVDDVDTNEVLNKLHWDCRINYVRDAISASKKLAKVKVSHPMVDAARAVVAKVLPLALVMEDLKSKIVKGRRPNHAAEARKAAKLNNPNAMKRATCACCFENQAVLPNGLIHDHGYQIPREWMKTASCYGRQFRPLEVSDDGLKFMVDFLTTAEAHMVEKLAATKKATRITRRNFKDEEVVYTPGHPDWKYRHEAAIGEVEYSLKQVRHDLGEFKKALAEWAPKAP